VLLVLKLFLVPALIAGVSLAGRRWGPRVAGVLTGLPLVAGPVLLFLALEQGAAFGARAALSTLAALVGVAGFCVVYAWAALHRSWAVGLLAGWATFAVAAAAVHIVPWRPSLALAAALASFAVGRAALPGRTPGGTASRRGAAMAARRPPWDLWLRMGSAATLVLVTTSLAARLGPALSGVLTPFPVAVSVLAAFAHAQQGVPALLALLGGLLPSMWSFAVFCYVLAVGLEPLGIAPAFALALGVQLAIQGLLLARLRPVRP
jgi:hypothetical protein